MSKANHETSVIEGSSPRDEAATSPLPGSQNDIGATSKEHESMQCYLQGFRLRLMIVAYVKFKEDSTCADMEAYRWTESACACSSRTWKFLLSQLP